MVKEYAIGISLHQSCKSSMFSMLLCSCSDSREAWSPLFKIKSAKSILCIEKGQL